MSEERSNIAQQDTADPEEEPQSANVDPGTASYESKPADVAIKQQQQQHSEDSASSSVNRKVICNNEDVEQANESGDSTVKNTDPPVEGLSPEQDGRLNMEEDSSIHQADDKSHGDGDDRGMPVNEKTNAIPEAVNGEEKASETTTSPVRVDGPKEDQVDGPKEDQVDEPTTIPDEESSTTNNRNGDAEQDGEDLLSLEEEEDAHANTTSAQMPLPQSTTAPDELFQKRREVENLGPVAQESTKPTVTEDTGVARGSTRYLIGVALVVIVAIVVQQLLQPESPPQEHDVRQIDIFLKQMEKVKTLFPNQRVEVWSRSKIHLKRHLQTSQPTEPVSLILTAGLRAERTLHCLARGLASAFSSALNASVLHIDGTSKANQDSDQVKLDIDNKLQKAFEGDKPVAVIHRFEELPPGSTLIFYRYCDHENAAYKKIFLIFTVLLGDEAEIPAQIRLSTVEEMVDDHLQKRFLSHGHPVSFDKMDLDKYGGLWSRISHLILPVAAENRIEDKGCQNI